MADDKETPEEKAHIDAFKAQYDKLVEIDKLQKDAKNPTKSEKAQKSLEDIAWAGNREVTPDWVAPDRAGLSELEYQRIHDEQLKNGLEWMSRSRYVTSADLVKKYLPEYLARGDAGKLVELLDSEEMNPMKPQGENSLLRKMNKNELKTIGDYRTARIIDSYGDNSSKEETELVIKLSAKRYVKAAEEKEKKRQDGIDKGYQRKDLIELAKAFAEASLRRGEVKDETVKRYALAEIGAEENSTKPYAEIYKTIEDKTKKAALTSLGSTFKRMVDGSENDLDKVLGTVRSLYK